MKIVAQAIRTRYWKPGDDYRKIVLESIAKESRDGDIVAIETPGAAIRVKAKLTDAVSPDVVCTQHGWWQECQELKLPGYDPYSASGANVNLLYTGKHFDPLSGSYPNRGYPCRVRKL